MWVHHFKNQCGQGSSEFLDRIGFAGVWVVLGSGAEENIGTLKWLYSAAYWISVLTTCRSVSPTSLSILDGIGHLEYVFADTMLPLGGTRCTLSMETLISAVKKTLRSYSPFLVDRRGLSEIKAFFQGIHFWKGTRRSLRIYEMRPSTRSIYLFRIGRARFRKTQEQTGKTRGLCLFVAVSCRQRTASSPFLRTKRTS